MPDIGFVSRSIEVFEPKPLAEPLIELTVEGCGVFSDYACCFVQSPVSASRLSAWRRRQG
jgi:hypothetical protein